MLGKFGDCGALVSLLPVSSKTSASERPSLPKMPREGGGVGDVEAGGNDDRVDLTGRCRSVDDDPVRTSSMPSVTRSTFAWASVG